ncbi:hypothetical protein MJI37_25605, partial [Salmonella enterica subsp. enterica serovar Cerro]|nr:hypothetical protein [Salmonella enterica subsp. enterica serovar Cerro]
MIQPPAVFTLGVDHKRIRGDIERQSPDRGQAWWPKQSLIVFQPLLPPDWKMTLREGSLYAQVAF